MSSIQNVGTSTPNLPKTNVQFRNTSAKSLEVQEEPQKEGLSKNAKWAIGLGLTTAAALGIYLITRGKKAPVKPPVPTPPATPATSGKPQIPENLSHLDMDLFKQHGKFNKGEAIFNGKPFTGTIYAKNGTEMTYHNGVLERAKGDYGSKWYKNGKISHVSHNNCFVGRPKETIVKRLQDGTCVITKRLSDYSKDGLPQLMDNTHDIVTTIKPNGNITRVTGSVKRNTKQMNGTYICDKIENLTTGEVKLVKKGFIPNSGDGRYCVYKQHKIIDGKKITEKLDSSGKLLETWVTEFNPKTKVSTQTVKKSNGKIRRIIQRTKDGYVLECNPKGINQTQYEPSYRLWKKGADKCSDEMGEFSMKNKFAIGVTKERIRKYILENDLPFEI